MSNVAIIGAGTMGHSLAQLFAQGGHRVFLNDLSKENLDKASRLIASNLETLYEVGLLKATEKSTILKERITYTVELSVAVATSDLVIEAIFEDQRTKKELFSQLDRLSPPQAIFASNTSYLNIYQFVDTERPDRLIITHWLTPPHIMPLVEIVPGPLTSPGTIATVKQIVDDLGKESVVLGKFIPGFISNRLMTAITREAFYLLDNGYATPEDIEKVTTAGFGLRMPVMGLLERLDFVGLDLIQRALDNKSYTPPPVDLRPNILDSMISQERLGVKTGRGFLDYGGASYEEILKKRDLKLLKLKEFLTSLKTNLYSRECFTKEDVGPKITTIK
jgi:3-hydroxybutyryl-CoA dehydrogenase